MAAGLDFPKHLSQGAEEQVAPPCLAVRLGGWGAPQRPSATDSSIQVFQLGRRARAGGYALPCILASIPPRLPHAQGTRLAKTKMQRTFANRDRRGGQN